MASSKKRKRKQKVSFVRSEPPRAAGNSNVIAFPSQAPASPSGAPGGGRPSVPMTAPRGVSMTPDPLPETAHRTSIIEAEVADVVGDEVAGDAPARVPDRPSGRTPASAQRASTPARASAATTPGSAARTSGSAAPTPGSVGLAEGSVDDEDTVVGADIPRAPGTPTRIGAASLEYEDDVTSVDAQPLGSRRAMPPSRPAATTATSAAPAAAPGADDDDLYPESEVTPVEGIPAAAADDGTTDDRVDEHPHEESFFSSAPPAAPAEDHFDDLKAGADELPVGDRRAMRWTIGIAAFFVFAIGGYWIYQNVILPEPVALGEAEPAKLPDPSLLEESAGVEEQGEGAPDEAEVAAAAEAVPDEAAEAEETGPAGEEQIADVLDDAVDAEELSVSPEELAAIVALPEGEPATDGTYEELVTEGESLEQRSDFEEAEKMFRSALALEPQGAKALAHLGFIMLNRGETENARAVAEYAVAIDPKNSTGWITLGAARQALSDYSGARDAYRTCVLEGEGKYVEECRRMMR